MTGALRPAWRFDLHMHSDRSDGRFSPQEVLARCARGGLDVVALTDHDLGTDLAPGWHTVEDRRVYVLAGAEVSGMHDGREYHLLVYFPGEIPQGFRELCREQCLERAARYQEALRRIDLPGLPEATQPALRGDTALTRLHLARGLVQAGHASHVREAFSRFLAEAHRNVPPLSLPFTDAIRLSRAFGGITSWAHPPLPAVDAHVDALAAAGLQGLEALRPMVTSDERRRYRQVASRLGLFLTGGSDWHGWTEPGDPGLFRVQAREISDFVDVLLAA